MHVVNQYRSRNLPNEHEWTWEIELTELTFHHLLSLSLRSRDELLCTEFIHRSQPATAGLERRILLRDIDAYLKSRASEPTFVRDYTIFWLYYREGMTAKAIAGVPSIGLTVKGVESTLLRLTRLVRNRFDQRSGGLGPASSRMLARETQPEG